MITLLLLVLTVDSPPSAAATTDPDTRGQVVPANPGTIGEATSAASSAASSGASSATSPTGGIPSFSVQRLAVDANEGCAVADFDGDGDLDLAAGRFWFANPGDGLTNGDGDWLPRPLRMIPDWRGYTESNGEHALDIDGDGDADIVAGSFLGTEVKWYENPGPEGLALGQLWAEHVLADTGQSKNEMSIVRDLDGDGRPEWIANSWMKEAPFVVWTIRTGDDPGLEPHPIGEAGNGHGIAFGDINNDGHEDILVGQGWYERPAEGGLDGDWAWHEDWPGGHFSCPMLVGDYTGDGRADIVWGAAHDYGLFLWTATDSIGPDAGQSPETDRSPETNDPSETDDPSEADAQLAFSETNFDPTIAQLHALVAADLDGDGVDEVVSGRRFRAHNGKDPGADDPLRYVAYRWAGGRLMRVSLAEGVGAGLQIRVVDLDGDGDLDIASSGKDGTEILWNRSPSAGDR